MKRNVLYKIIILILALISMGAIFTACSVTTEAALYSIKIFENNEFRIRYNVGEELDVDGLFIKGTYSDFSVKNIPVTIDMVTVPDMETLGDHKVEVKYLGKKTSYYITIGHFETVTVDFYVDGIYWRSKTTIKGERLYNPPIPPEKYGYTQITPGWSLEEGGEKVTLAIGQAQEARKFEEDADLFSIYTINKYTVTFMIDGRAVSAVSNVVHGTLVAPDAIPEIPSKTHYDRRTPNWEKNLATFRIESDIIINAVYYINTYEVRFDLTGGVPIGNFTGKFEDGCIIQNVEYQKNAVPPGNSRDPRVRRDGYIFIDWIGTYERVESDVTVSATWMARNDTEYKVEYYFQRVDGNYFKDDYVPENWSNTGIWPRGGIGTTDTLSPVFNPVASISVNASERYRINWTLTNTRTQIYGDGSGVCKIYYDYMWRNLTVVNSNTKAGSVSGAGCDAQGPAENGILYPYESGLTVTATAFAGYTFAGWYDGGTLLSTNTIYNFKLNDPLPSNPNPVPRNRTLTARWTANTNTPYRVEFYFQNIQNNNYTINNSFTQYLTGTTDTICSATAVGFTGFTFNAAQTVAGGSTVSGTTVSGNIDGNGSRVLRIYYTRNSYTLTFLGNGGKSGNETSKSQDVKYEAAFTSPSFEYSGYMFQAWNRIDTGQPEEWLNYTDDPDGRLTIIMPAYSMTFEIQWRIGIFSINFICSSGGTIEINGSGSGFAGGSTYEGAYYYQEMINLRAIPKAGYSFTIDNTVGWFIKNLSNPDEPVRRITTNPYDFKMPGYDCEIEARFIASPNTRFIIQHWFQNIADDNYTLNTLYTNNRTGTTDTTADATQFIRTEIGFYRDEIRGQLKGNIEGDGSLILTIYYNRYIYTVNFILNGGTVSNGASVSVNLRYEASFLTMPGVLMPELAGREGYRFEGWTDKEGAAFGNNTKISEAQATGLIISITANWAVLPFNLKVANDTSVYGAGNISLSHPAALQVSGTSISYGTGISLMATPNPGYNFEGWYDAVTKLFVSLGTLTGGTYIYTFNMPAYNVSLEARWSACTDTPYAVIIKLEKVEDDELEPYALYATITLYGTSGANITFSDISDDITAQMTGTNFNWKKEDNSGTIYERIEGNGSRVITIELLRPRYEVTFNGNGGTQQSSGNNITILTVKEGGTVAAPTYGQQGYTFMGWDTALGPITENITISAQWTINSYTLTVVSEDTNKGTVSGTPDGIYEYNSSITLIANTITGTFIGWYDQSGNELSTDTIYTFNMREYNLKVTAKWN